MLLYSQKETPNEKHQEDKEMKKAKFRTYYNARSVKMIRAIIKNEDLEVTLNHFTDALGDSIIEADGYAEDIKILREIFRTVCC